MKAFLFDLDGTLIDSADDIALSLKLTLKEIGMLERMPSDVRRLIGGGVRALLENVLGEDFKEEYVSIFRRYYISNPVVHTKPYEGILETLKELKTKGKTLVVVTNKLEDISREILRQLNILHYFDLIVGGDTFPEKKPSPLPVIRSLEIIGVEPSAGLMIGDTEADIKAGREAGTKTALATWGYVRLNSIKPDIYLKHPSELLSLA